MPDELSAGPDLGGAAAPRWAFSRKYVTPCVLPARWRFEGVALDDGLGGPVERLRAIPGVFLWPRETPRNVSAPTNAVAIVARTLDAAGAPWGRLRAPTMPPPVGNGLDVLRTRLAGSEWRPDRWDWLMPFQRDGAAFLARREGGHEHAAPGAGKTAIAVAWALAAPGPVCVVTPAIVRSKWRRDLTMLADVDPHVIDPRTYARRRAERLDGYLDRAMAEGFRPIVVGGWEGLAAWIADLAAVPWASVVYDESQECKNPRRNRWILAEGEHADGSARLAPVDLGNTSSAAKKLAAAALRRLCVSATPMPDRVRDLWAQLDLVEPGCWGPFGAFARRYCAAVPGQFGGLDSRGASNLDELRERMAFSRHHVPRSVTHAHLPPKRRAVTWLRPEHQDRPAGGFAARLRRAAREGDEQLTFLRLAEAASRKRTAIRDTVRAALAAGQKVVVGTGLREDCDRLAELLANDAAAIGARLGRAVWFEKAHGEDDPTDRDALRAAYMASPGPALLVVTISAFAVGVDLQDTDYVATAMFVWNPGLAWQWEDRFSRQGQRRPVLIEWFGAEGTIDEHVAAIIVPKLEQMDRVVPDTSLDGLGDALRGLGDPAATLAAIMELARASAEAEEN